MRGTTAFKVLQDLSSALAALGTDSRKEEPACMHPHNQQMQRICILIRLRIQGTSTHKH